MHTCIYVYIYIYIYIYMYIYIYICKYTHTHVYIYTKSTGRHDPNYIHACVKKNRSLLQNMVSFIGLFCKRDL